jgi:ADP-ribose pyrophosphatase YjhB (NUDIX family)
LGSAADRLESRPDTGTTVDCSAHKLVADVALYAGGRVLLVKYEDTSKYDRQRGWFLPNDFLDHLEHPDDAARIVREQLGREPPELGLEEIESFGDGAWHLVFHYRGSLAEPVEPVPGQNVAAAQWFPLDALPPATEVAHHGWALDVIEKMLAGER